MRLAVVDVETTYLADGERPRTLFWGLKVEGEEYRRFDTTADLFADLKRKEKLCIYHHHDYDAVQAIIDGAKLVVKDVRGGRILRAIDCWGNEWRNSHALFPSALKEILEACGFKKPELTDLEARNLADTEDALTAFRMLATRYERIFGVYPLGERYLTAASVAFSAAESVSGKLPIYLQHRDTYRGGRVEAFRLGPCGEADLYDICSSYPYAFCDAPPSDTLYRARVEIDTDGPGPFCAIGRDREKLMFPAGRFETAFWASNYERYIRPHLGGVIRQLQVIETVPCDLGWLHNLSGMILGAYQARVDAKARKDEVTRYCVKIGLNSIYGRLGMKESREIAIFSASVPAGDDVPFCSLPGGGFLSFKKVASKPAANYLFASWITDNARARLFDALARTTPYYCDTDSIFIPKGQGMPLPQGNMLGEWKYEGTNTLDVIGAKDYSYGPAVKLKGGAGRIRWTMKSALRGQPAKMVMRTRRSSYDKREVLPSGKTLPVTMRLW